MRKGNFFSVCLMLFFAISTLSISMIMCTYGSAVVWTDKPDYAFWETVTIYGSGFNPNTNINLAITRPDSVVDTGSTMSDTSGNFVYYYVLNGLPGTYAVTATDGVKSASTTFTEKAITLELFGYTLEPSPGWTHGDVKGYYECQWVPYKIEIESTKEDSYQLTVVVHHDYFDGTYYGLDQVRNFAMQRNGLPESPSISGPVVDGWESGIQQLQWSWTFTINKDETCTLMVETHIAIGAYNYPGSKVHTHIHGITPVPDTPISGGHRDVPVVVKGPPPTGSVIVWKYEDADGNIATTGDWTPIDWTVHLLNGTVNQDFALGGDGTITFTGQSGSVTVTEADDPAWTHLNATNSWTQTVQGGQTYIVKFVNFHNVDIKVWKFEDLTGNGKTADDTPIAGWTVRLYKNNVLFDTKTTGADGSYTWTNLGSGSYKVDEIVPAGWTPTSATSNDFGTVSSGQTYSFTFTNFHNVDIKVIKVVDADGNLATTGDQTPKQGWTVSLYKNNVLFGTSQLTGADGSYTWSNLGPGSYRVEETVPATWTSLDASTVHDFGTVTSGHATYVWTFHNFYNVDIKVYKKVDVDGNGATTADDVAKSGWTVYLWTNGVKGTGVQTVADGSYTWSNLGPGSYKVSEDTPAGWTPTSATSNEFGAVTSGHATYEFTFTNFKLGKISGHKFNDLNGNGVWDKPTEPALSGWTITLNPGGVTKVTDGTGYYEFTGLTVGTYTVSETLQAGWVQTMPAAPGTYSVAITSGSDVTDMDFGNKGVPPPPPPPVGGVWVPINKFQLLAPWIGWASLMTVVTVSFVYVERKKKRQK